MMKKLGIFFGLVMVIMVLSGSGSTMSAVEKAVFNVASYNLRQLNDGDTKAGNGWGRRCPVLGQVIRYHEFDIFGTQEGFKTQLDELKALLPGYDYIGAGRENGKDAGEHSAIFYNTEKFKLLDHGDFWISETPDKPGLGWDAVCPRICSWGKFRHKESGREFVMFNLHMDHVGKKARVEGAKLVRSRIDGFGRGCPAFVTGDFNVDQTSPSYRTITAGGDLLDSYEVAQLRYALNGTFNSYKTDNYTDSRIDHVFVTPGVKVLKYGVLTDTYRTPENSKRVNANDAPEEIEVSRYVARTPSDHFPVVVRVSLDLNNN